MITVRSGARLAGNPVLRACRCCRAVYRSDFERCPLDGGELAVATTDPLVGSILGERYAIDALIGEGAMGRVYRVHHTRLPDKHYALKVLLGDYVASAAMRMRFANEARAVARLDHTNIVGLIDFARSPEGLLYLVMELVDGTSLARVARSGPMPSSRLLALARQLCDGLAHAHARGVVHRDFKPENILVSGGGDREIARIVDFGLAISAGGEDVRLTTSGVCCTPAYAAPEQLLGRPIDHRVDLYALGATLYELATGGVLPFSGSADDVVAQKLSGRARSIAEYAPNLPSRLIAVIDRLLVADPDARFASALDARAALDDAHVIARAPTVRSAPVFSTVVAPPRRARGRWLVAAVAGMATLALAVPGRSHGAETPLATLEPEPEPLAVHVWITAPELPRPPILVRALAAPVAPARPARRPAPSEVALRIVRLDVAGALPASAVRHDVERTLAHVHCPASVRVIARFAISEDRRTRELRASGHGARCVLAAISGLRSGLAPDVGDAHVTLTVTGAAPPPPPARVTCASRPCNARAPRRPTPARRSRPRYTAARRRTPR